MKQGELWYADLNPVKGREKSGLRPVLIISGNLLNQYMDIVICCPLTSKIKSYKGNLVLETDKQNNLKQRSEVLTFHIRSISKQRLVRLIGKVNNEEILFLKKSLDEILRY